MESLRITTNNVPRDLLTFSDLSEKERSDFDYIFPSGTTPEEWPEQDESYSLRFFRYRGNVYDSHEFVRIVDRSVQNAYGFGYGFAHHADSDSPLLAWSGIQTDSFFSAIVLRYPRQDCWHDKRKACACEPDWERVVIGLALS